MLNPPIPNHMKKIYFILCLLAAVICSSCKQKNGQTTNISTSGTVLNTQSNRLEGIAVITTIEGSEKTDTVYTNIKGEFFSRVKGIPYPIPSVKVEAVDPKGVYQSQSKTPSYTYECGVGFDPEKDYAYADHMEFELNTVASANSPCTLYIGECGDQPDWTRPMGTPSRITDEELDPYSDPEHLQAAYMGSNQLRIVWLKIANCCPELITSATVENRTITLSCEDIGTNPCACDCFFPLYFDFDSLAYGRYTIVAGNSTHSIDFQPDMPPYDQTIPRPW